MITATFEEGRYQLVPVEVTNEILLDLAMVVSWDNDEEGGCSERDFAYESYELFLANMKDKPQAGVIIEKDVKLPDNVKVELNVLNVLSEVSGRLFDDEGLSAERLEKMFHMVNTGMTIAEAAEEIIKCTKDNAYKCEFDCT